MACQVLVSEVGRLPGDLEEERPSSIYPHMQAVYMDVPT